MRGRGTRGRKKESFSAKMSRQKFNDCHTTCHHQSSIIDFHILTSCVTSLLLCFCSVSRAFILATMGKKSKKNKKKKAVVTVSQMNNLSASAEDRTQNYPSVNNDVTIDEVRALPAAPNHVWEVQMSSDQSSIQVNVVDISNSLFHGAKREAERIMLSGRCDINDSHAVVTIIFNAMVAPTYQADPSDPSDTYHTPRRPHFLLIRPKLKGAYAKIKEQVELTGIPVRLVSSSLAYKEALTNAEEKTERHLFATYTIGFSRGPTAALVKATLPLKQHEVWRVRFCVVPERKHEGVVLLRIENVTCTPIEEVGGGFVHGCNMPQAILATMLSPMEAGMQTPNSIFNETTSFDKGEPRRPGLLLVDPGLAVLVNHFQDAFLGSGVEVKLHDASSNLCGNAGCYRVDAPEDLLDCSCKTISYCSEECHRANWKNHKNSCPVYKEKHKSK